MREPTIRVTFSVLDAITLLDAIRSDIEIARYALDHKTMSEETRASIVNRIAETGRCRDRIVSRIDASRQLGGFKLPARLRGES